MNGCRNSFLLFALALALVAAGAALWTVGLGATGAWPLRTAAGVVWLAAVAGVVWSSIHFAARPWQEIQRTLDLLSRMSFDDLSTAASNGELPALPPGNPFSPVVQRLTSLLAEAQQRVDQSQQQRSAVEVRARRQEAQAERMAAVLASLPEPVLVVDAYDELLLANASARKLFRLPEEPIERRVVSDLVRCERLLELLQETRRTKDGRHAQRRSPIARPPTAASTGTTSRPARLQRESSAAGESSGGTVVVLRDISHQKGIQKRNAEFVSAVSHEMKTPLAGIKAYVETAGRRRRRGHQDARRVSGGHQQPGRPAAAADRQPAEPGPHRVGRRQGQQGGTAR